MQNKLLVLIFIWSSFPCCSKKPDQGQLDCLNFYDKVYDIVIQKDMFGDDPRMDIAVECKPGRYLQEVVPCMGPSMEKMKEEFLKVSQRIGFEPKEACSENSSKIVGALQKELRKFKFPADSFWNENAYDGRYIFISSFKCNMFFLTPNESRRYYNAIYVKYKYKYLPSIYSSIFLENGEELPWDI